MLKRITKKKNGIWFLLGLLLTGGGAYLLSIDGAFIKIFGAVISTSGAFLTYWVSTKSSSEDKKEVIEKINEFRDKLESIKVSSSEFGTQQKINDIENHFDVWARNLKSTIGEKRLELQSKDMEFEKLTVDLSRKYRNFYVCFFEILDNLISAYNKNNSNEVSKIENDAIPLNLYSKESIEFKTIIKFQENLFWYLLLAPREPLKEAIIPSIALRVQNDSERPIMKTLGADLAISFNLKHQKLSADYEDGIFRKNKFEFPQSLDKYEIAVKDILQQAFEFQIALMQN